MRRLRDFKDIEKKLVLANFPLVLLVILAERFPGERWWPTLILAYAPQELWALPSIVLTIFLILQRKWLLSVAAVVPLFLVATMLMGMAVPHSATIRHSYLRVLTWNLYFGRGGAHLPEVALDTMPDVICLQESDPWATRELPKMLKLPQFHNWNNAVCGELVILSRFPMKRVGTTNSALWTIIDTGEKRVVVVNTHLETPFEASIGELLDCNKIHKAEELREKQIAELLNHLPDYPPTIVCGDFNTGPTTKTYRQISTLMDSCFVKTGRGLGLSYERALPLVRIDHIFVTRNLHPVHCWLPQSTGSNHKPMCADISF